MNEYNLIAKFTYKNKKYQLLTDSDDRYFFLEINNHQFSYVPLETFIELCNIFCKYPNVMNMVANNNGKVNFIPNVIIKGIATILTLSMLTGCSDASSISFLQTNIENDDNVDTTQVDYVQRDVDFNVVDSENKLKIDTYIDHAVADYIFVYDLNTLNNYLEYENVSKEEIFKILANNADISDKFKIFVKEFIDSLYSKYPDCDKRVFYENLKTLKIIECDDITLMKKSGNKDSYACYVFAENAIYTLDDYIYEKGTWEYQVIMHELCHAFRNGIIQYGAKDIKVSSAGPALSLVTVDEALNSVFAVSLFDYEERNIAYQLQSNYCMVMLECLDNYNLSDYVNHSLSYYASKLDEHNSNNNYAKVILTLIDTQYKDFHSDLIEIEQEEYYPIYDYIADMYYRKYIDSSMPYNEAKIIANELIEKVTYDIPNDYNIDTNRFYEYLDKYCNSIGIEINNITKKH